MTKWEPLPSKRIRVNSTTFAPLGRFNGVPAICFADGSTKNVEIETLTDQTLWIPQAQQVGDVPASEFSHTQ